MTTTSKKEELREEANKTHMKVFTTPPKVEKVKLNKEGRAGAVIGFNDCVSSNGVGRHDHGDKTIYIPVPKSLRKYFDLLKEYMLENFSYSWSNETEKEMLLSKARCTSVYYSQASDKFSLSGHIVYKGSDVKFPLNGQKMQLSGYDYEQELKDIFEKLFKEAELFLTGMKTADTKQVVADFLYMKQGMENAEEEFDNMSKEEQDKYIGMASELFGLEVVINEDGEKVISMADDEPADPTIKKIKERIVNESEAVLVMDDDESPNFDEENDETFVPPSID